MYSYFMKRKNIDIIVLLVMLALLSASVFFGKTLSIKYTIILGAIYIALNMLTLSIAELKIIAKNKFQEENRRSKIFIYKKDLFYSKMEKQRLFMVLGAVLLYFIFKMPIFVLFADLSFIVLTLFSLKDNFNNKDLNTLLN